MTKTATMIEITVGFIRFIVLEIEYRRN
jgi:hypothetical protein